MKRLIAIAAMATALPVAAFAADLPTTKGPPVYTPPPVFTWTGFYVGGQAGYQWGRTNSSLFTPGGVFVEGLPGYNDSGVVGGAHAGYNYQINQIVIGVEGDVEGSTFQGSTTALTIVPTFSYLATRIPLQGSLRGRIGYTWDRALIYATGGLALADIHNVFEATPVGAAVLEDSFWNVRAGWTVGGGIDYAIDPNWSVGLEYRYTDFGHYWDTLVNTYPGFHTRVRLYDNAVRAGFSYKFDMMSPVVSKY